MNSEDPGMNGREKRFMRAIQRLGAERFISFVRAVRADRCTAVELINEALDAGSTLESTFVTGNEFGYSISVKRLGKGRFLIGFGCQAGPLAGDGGEWEVRFDEHDAVASVVPGVFWIS